MKQEVTCDICGKECGITHCRIQFSEIYHSLQKPVENIKACDDCALEIGDFIQKMKGKQNDEDTV